MTVEPPEIVLARENVTLGLAPERSVYCVEFMKYTEAVSFQTNPNAFSKRRHALRGSHIFGSVDSTNAYIESCNSEVVVCP